MFVHGKAFADILQIAYSKTFSLASAKLMERLSFLRAATRRRTKIFLHSATQPAFFCCCLSNDKVQLRIVLCAVESVLRFQSHLVPRRVVRFSVALKNC